jgi:predicted TIM-barrel fold metal-dependent hydrolase
VDLEKALASFDKVGFKQPVKDKILFANAQALFGV